MSTYTIRDERGVTFRNSGQLVTESCPNCHILYAIPRSLYDRAVERSQASQHRTLLVYCPNGHSWSFTGKNEEQRLRDKLAKQKRATDDVLDRLNATEKDRRRIVKRVESGVCMECNRTFQNLLKHMARKHGHKPAGSLSALLVHKLMGRGDAGGTQLTKCYEWAPRERTSRRWADTDCPDCLAKRPKMPAEAPA